MYHSITKLLDLINISFDEIEHSESKSCDDSKKIREKA
jgi:hypothetical protein